METSEPASPQPTSKTTVHGLIISTCFVTRSMRRSIPCRAFFVATEQEKWPDSGMPAVPAYAPDFATQARYLFDLYTGPESIAAIEALPGQSPKVFETNWLEFKSGLTRDDDLKYLWSKALGSFANSGGGVVIWGVSAERDAATGIDAVKAIVPVPDVHRLATKLKDFQPPATDPPIKGVVIQPLLLPGQEPQGFVVCLIPQSDSKPHRSEWGKGEVKRFHMRIGDSTQECTVPILRQLFYPQTGVSA